MSKKNIKRARMTTGSFFSRVIFILILCAAFLSVLFLPALAAEDKPFSFSQLAREASPAVVNISAIKVFEGPQGMMMPYMNPFGEENPFKDFFERFFGPQMPKKYKQRSLGSGFIIDREGFILTNNHVVEKTEEIKVTLHNDSEYEAEVVGKDPKTDLALIKIVADQVLNPLPLGDSDMLDVGDWVLAIGSPFGLGHTVTAGIVSAKYRRIGAGAYDDFIQTDASINPGNSGGPLLNTEGEVVGINTAIFSRSGGNIGIGFAVPVNMAKSLLPQLKEGKVIRGWMGVMIQEITPELKDKLELQDERGALVANVTEGGPADKAGIKRGDVIVSYDGKDIEKMQDLPFLVASTPVGREVSVTVVREGVRKRLTVEIEEMKEELEEEATAGREGPKLGMELKELTPQLARRLGVSKKSGIIVVRVERQSPAVEAGIRPGDLILEVDRQPVKDMEDFNRAISRYGKGDTILFLVERGGQTLFRTLNVRD
jgi:serine protease Do